MSDGLHRRNSKPQTGGIEKEIAKYATDAGHTKLTEEKAKDWCNVCRVFIEALGKLSPTMQRGALENMFRVVIDHGGDIKAGIKSYSGLASAEKERLSAAEDTKMLTSCNDDGAIILKLIKSLLEPLSPDLV